MSTIVRVASCLALALLASAGAQAQQCSVTSVSLVAGQHNYAGTVSVARAGSDICVTYASEGGWLISETHLAISSSLEGIPQTGSGNPKPGQFSYATSHRPAVSTFTYCVASPAATVYIAAHAVVQNGSQRETAWAGDLDFPGANWATYFIADCPVGDQS